MIATGNQRRRATGFPVGTRLLSAALSVLTGLVCLALLMAPAVALDVHDMDESGAWRISFETGIAAAAHVGAGDQDHRDQDHGGPDLHGAHHCCHSHVVPAGSLRRMGPAPVRHLTWRMGDSDGLSRTPPPLLRPPRI